MRGIVLLLLAFLVSGLASASEQEKSATEVNINKHCSAEWTKRGKLDTEMYNYCAGNQRESLSDLRHLKSEIGSLDWYPAAEGAIWKKWTTRGVTDYALVHYELKSEHESYLNILYSISQKTVDKTKLQRCRADWQTPYVQWSLIEYCLNN